MRPLLLMRHQRCPLFLLLVLSFMSGDAGVEASGAGDVVVVVASAAVAAAAVAAEEELLALFSNIPGGEGSIAAHPNTLHRESGKRTGTHTIREIYSRQLSPVGGVVLSSAVSGGPRVAL